ncbi:MAG: hypothetical protein WAM69_06640 [Candidatus Sulfotelmatobacter sp.]
MTTASKRAYASTLILMALGLIAQCSGARWLLLLVPVAILVWFGAAGTAYKTRQN